MATVTGLTAARMLQIEASCIVDGAVDLPTGNLVLERYDGGKIIAGNVRGLGFPEGGTPGQALIKGETYGVWRNLDATDIKTGVFPQSMIDKPPTLPSSGSDLNNYVTNGNWHQPLTVGASTGTNYPIGYAGMLEVQGSGSTSYVYQRYTTFANTGSRVFVRGCYSGTWQSWKELAPYSAGVDRLSPGTGYTNYMASPGNVSEGMALQVSDSAGRIAGAYNNAVVWAFNTTGQMTHGSVPAERVTSGVFDNARIPAQSWTSITGKPSTYPPSAHSHGIGDISGDIPYSKLAPPFEIADTGSNLNNYVTSGVWTQSQNVGASAGSNYPASVAGLLEVQVNDANNMVWQRYTTYQAYNKVYTRGRYEGSWSAWKELSTTITAAGTVAISAAANAVRSASVAFPSGRFDSGDTIAVTTGIHTAVPQNRSAGISNVTNTGVTINLWANESISITVSWIAGRVG